MAGTYENWQAVIEPLARHHTVRRTRSSRARHRSAPSGGDYSLGAHATSLRDLLVALGHDRATLVGHSLGGGIAMQISYQFPEITERLVLGGLGLEVSPVLRAAALPGADLFIAATAGPGRIVGSALARGLAAVGLRPNADIAESRADTRRSPTQTVAPRSWPRCAPSSALTASASMPATGCTSPRACPFSSSGGSAIR